MNRSQKQAVRDKMADFVEGKLDPNEALRVLDAVEQDRGLSGDLDLHVELLNLARSDAAPDLLEIPEVLKTPGRAPRVPRSLWGGILNGRRVLVPVGVFLGLMVAAFAVVAILARASNPYGTLAEIGDPGESFRMRGGSDAELADASARLVEGDPGEAANRFERFIRMYPASEWAPWVEYAAGLSRLANARMTTLGVGVRYDAGEVRRGLEHLDRVLEGTAVPELLEDALWYRSKGCLMLGDASSAEGYLTRILALQGTRQAVALKLLSDLRSTHH